MSDQMSRRGFMGAAATGAVALAGFALAGCSSTSASSEKSSEKEKTVKPVILVTSFGTSYNDSRHITIGAIEDAIREKYWQDYDIRRAFTAQIIIDKLKKRDGITIDNMTEALDRCVEDGVKEIVVQPTHLMAGLEYADVKDELDKYADKFDKISLGDPLLTSDDDYKKVAAAIKGEHGVLRRRQDGAVPHGPRHRSRFQRRLCQDAGSVQERGLDAVLRRHCRG